MGDRGQVDLGNRRGEGELGRVERGKLKRMYCMREESKFSIFFKKRVHKELCGSGGRKILRASGDGNSQGNKSF